MTANHWSGCEAFGEKHVKIHKLTSMTLPASYHLWRWGFPKAHRWAQQSQPRREGACTAADTRLPTSSSPAWTQLWLQSPGQRHEIEGNRQWRTGHYSQEDEKHERPLTCLQISIPFSPFNKVYQIINKTVIEKKMLHYPPSKVWSRVRDWVLTSKFHFSA